ncbi:tRNA1(Val) (adenine(37)-N6)-methyltransferase [Paenibacillus silviterrae]|uniref:tRNA1(Val) (adenine(37)-N6)-methyltransferase n=1 Tax=Paenibacillus silviterrae TaxID=3242194 RepID=UPI00254385C2|nr:tRNA1(Val) (adenine(37)-N6)-methyltransferase [Paenibacillus chinjuensis]
MENGKVTLQPTERIDDLLTHDLRIIQSDEVFSFSLDAVLLARFCYVPPRGRIVDLCSGNGVIPLLLTTRTKAHITGVEIQDRLADMARRNIRLNGLEDRIHMIHGDLRDPAAELGNGAFDVVTVNPPYLPVPNGDQNMNPHFAAARHEVHATLEDVVRASARLVRSGGRVAMVHRPSRLVEIFCTMRQYRLEPKRIRFVHPRADLEANMVLIEALRDGKPEVRMLPPLIVYKNKTEYSDELMEVYYGRSESLAHSDIGQHTST